MSKNNSNLPENNRFLTLPRVPRPRRPFLRLLPVLIPLLAIFALPGAAEAPKPLATTPELHPDLDRKHQKTCISAGCHSLQKTPGVPQHPPFREGRCLVCHVDHATSATHLLKPLDNSMCLSCHTGMAMATTGTTVLVHPPGGQKCIDCHNPHQSRVRNLLRDEDHLRACAKCHADFLAQAATLPYRHHYLDPKTECGTCHYAHRRPGERYLRENVAETCLTCHDLPIRVGDRVLENVTDRLRTAPVVHGAIAKGSCPACHTPHGSKQPSLLKAGYPTGSYETFQPEQYALCWQCHSRELAVSANGTGLTRFRNGEENLHHLHVARLKRGRACHLCHAAHASDEPHLLRQSVTFNQWKSPLVYKSLSEGGSCQTPCHKEREYSRTKAVKPE